MIILKNRNHRTTRTSTTRKGTINFFCAAKQYGSVKDSLTRHDYLLYGNSLEASVIASDYVCFDIEKTPTGLIATGVQLMG